MSEPIVKQTLEQDNTSMFDSLIDTLQTVQRQLFNLSEQNESLSKSLLDKQLENSYLHTEYNILLNELNKRDDLFTAYKIRFPYTEKENR
jgi:hypothetical protein